MSEYLEKIELIGEGGEKIYFIVDAIFAVEGIEYAVLSAEEDADEAILMRLDYDDENNVTFVQIEDDNEYEIAVEEYYAILDEQE